MPDGQPRRSQALGPDRWCNGLWGDSGHHADESTVQRADEAGKGNGTGWRTIGLRRSGTSRGALPTRVVAAPAGATILREHQANGPLRIMSSNDITPPSQATVEKIQ